MCIIGNEDQLHVTVTRSQLICALLNISKSGFTCITLSSRDSQFLINCCSCFWLHWIGAFFLFLAWPGERDFEPLWARLGHLPWSTIKRDMLPIWIQQIHTVYLCFSPQTLMHHVIIICSERYSVSLFRLSCIFHTELLSWILHLKKKRWTMPLFWFLDQL